VHVPFKGVAQAAVFPTFSILNITVDTSTVGEFRDVNGGQITDTDFFNFLRTDGSHTVKAKGTFNGSNVIWEEVELED